jgi:small subunit ribosomal protein S15
MLIAKPSWVQQDGQQLEELVEKLAKEGLGKSVIGLVLRDQFGIPSVKGITGKKIGKILQERKISTYDTEDLKHLTSKAEKMRINQERYRSDRMARHSLQLVESKIRRLGNYYKRTGMLPADWRYEPR